MHAELHPQPPTQRLNLFWLLAAAVLVFGVAGWLWRACEQKSEIRFLPRYASAEWIIYPKPLNPFLQGVADLPGVFRRELTLERVPASATLTVRAWRRCLLSINGQSVSAPSVGEHWREPLQVEVSHWLKPGSNVVEVTVINPSGPPALWAVLSGSGLQVATDQAWQVSYAGAVWRPAQLAAHSLDGQDQGNSASIEKPLAALVHCWPLVLLWLALAAGAVLGARWWLASARPRVPVRWAWTRDPARLTLAALVVLWVALLTHNAPLVPATAGFDAQGHLDYIKALQEHHGLPSAGQGWEAHQPPLYYLVCAAALKCCGLSADSLSGLVVLRCVGLGTAVLHLWILFSILRLLVPENGLAQAVGLVVVGLVPMQLYLAHYFTNEFLAACLMSATVLCLLHLLRDAAVSWSWFAAAGFCLGLALLTKITAVILVPFFAVVLLHRLVQSGAGQVRHWLFAGLASLTFLATCGWHYGRVWHETGHLLFAPNTALPWWQDPGYHTAEFFTRCGRALSSPFYSGASSFGDGLYSSCWGDGWRGGGPWNFQLVALGFWLALMPTALLVVGLGVVLVKSVRRPNLGWLLLLCFGVVMLEALVYFNLTSAAIGTVKAFYALGALSCLALAAASGWGWLERRLPWARVPLGVALGVWALNSVASHWVQPNAPATEAQLSRSLTRAGNYPAALAHAEAALAADPGNVSASATLADLLTRQGRLEEALAVVQRAVKAHPEDPTGYRVLVGLEKQQGHLLAAMETLRSLVSLSPDDGNSRLQLATLLFQTGHAAEAVQACRETLRVLPAEPEAHLLLACALERESAKPEAAPELAGAEPLSFAATNACVGDVLLAGAIQHFRLTLQLAPDSADVMRRLSWILATCPRAELRNGPEALALAKRACELSGNPNALLLVTLAASQAEAGDFAQALQTAEKAQQRLGTAGGEGFKQQLTLMQACFEQHRAYHREAL